MYLLRRTAARAISSAPSKAFLTKPRSITTYTPVASRSRQHRQWPVSLFQRRFASDEATKAEGAASESFSQTVAEVPADDTVTPVPEAPQAEPTDSSATVGVEALEAATEGKTESRKSGPDAAIEPNRTLYVGNLFYEVTEDQLKRIFSRFGEVDSVKVVYDNRGLSRGFGYVNFTNTDSAQSAVENLDMQVFEGRNLVVQFHKPRTAFKRPDANYSQQPPSKTLFIGNMSFEMSDKDLNELFRDIRNVIDVRVAIDRRTGAPRGFAHADFIDVASATKAKEVLKDKIIYGRQLRIDFSKSGTQQERNGARKNDRENNA